MEIREFDVVRLKGKRRVVILEQLSEEDFLVEYDNPDDFFGVESIKNIEAVIWTAKRDLEGES